MKRLCPFCEEYARKGDNYCRMCGFPLSAAGEQRSAVSAEYESPEKYCGLCGQPRAVCSGAHK